MQETTRAFGWPKIVAILISAAVLLLAPAVVLADDEDKERIDELEDRIEELEVKAAKDRVQFTGELRLTADNIQATQAERYDGIALQKGIVDTMFYFGATGMLPMSPDDVNNYVAENYGDYLYYQNNLTFDQIKQGMAMFPPAQQQALMQMLLPGTYVPEQDFDNNIMYTTRLRLDMRAKVKSNVTFSGRLGMYKAWGDSTGVQVFNGLPSSFTLDGSDLGVPNSDLVRVERAYFNWTDIGGSKWYASVGRRPSGGGPPLHIREAELRQGTPAGHVVNFQFDGITLGYDWSNWLPGNAFRFCYGVGFESGFGSGSQLQAPADRMKDVHLGGINWDIYYTDAMRIQTTVLGAWNVTDGFNGLLVLPVDPVSGNPINAPVVLRYTPSAHLGDIYLGNIVLERDDGPVTWFVSYAHMETKAENVTTPFGGLLADPFDVPEDQDAYSIYAGARFAVGSGYLGLEYNHGSQYWFNFTQAADDLVYSKLGTRGDVYEGYWIHEFQEGLGRARAKFRLGVQFYEYDYSGSGWQVGAPKKLGTEMPPVLGFPTYSDAIDIKAALYLKF
jgi:hypothetical protein